MRRLVLASVLVTAIAAPAFASDQLALQLGVEPGMYSTTDLMRLTNAREDGDTQREKFILGGGSEIISTQSIDTHANGQFVQQLGVEPGMFSTLDLMRLTNAREDGDLQREKFILNGGYGPTE
ncbi:hypothetical protein [Poseidonocella sp. HB161398]|uniref:hypothetical protein n=1 Tax=Poseidonocella sp. HB161398 TaxID=2320855 RepID=UPI001108954F|nr:hypothetical protein [Poseidonocella sp. HB161398]